MSTYGISREIIAIEKTLVIQEMNDVQGMLKIDTFWVSLLGNYATPKPQSRVPSFN